MIFSAIINKLKKTFIQVLLILILYFSFANFLPSIAHNLFYTISVFIKDLLVLILPISIGFFIANTVNSFEKKAPIFILFILIFEGLSNFVCTWYGYLSGSIVVNHLPSMKIISENYDFNVLWQIPNFKPSWWTTDKGVIAGLIIGCICALGNSKSLKKIIIRGKDISQWILTNIFSKLIAIFILGFIAKMYKTKMLKHLSANYSVFLIWLVILLGLYIVILNILGNKFSLKSSFRSIINLLPASGIAFTSGSSLSSMPWTIEGTSKNLKNPDFAKVMIPTTTNIQQVGDCIINSFLCLLIYNNFYGTNPDFTTWLHFSIIFIIARFATAAILGGAIFIMLPIYEKYLSFNAEMLAIILAFNVILDPIITSCNVLGNGSMCKIYEKIWMIISKISLKKNHSNH